MGAALLAGVLHGSCTTLSNGRHCPCMAQVEAPVDVPVVVIPTVDVVVPVHNEEGALEASITRLRRYLSATFPFRWQITIVDNASTDGTWFCATRLRDAQCGFKALRAEVAHKLLPQVRDDGWFFDTELLLLAERNGLRIHQVPVDWVDDADSRVHVARTALDDLAGTIRMAWTF